MTMGREGRVFEASRRFLAAHLQRQHLRSVPTTGQLLSTDASASPHPQLLAAAACDSLISVKASSEHPDPCIYIRNQNST